MGHGMHNQTDLIMICSDFTEMIGFLCSRSNLAHQVTCPVIFYLLDIQICAYLKTHNSWLDETSRSLSMKFLLISTYFFHNLFFLGRTSRLWDLVVVDFLFRVQQLEENPQEFWQWNPCIEIVKASPKIHTLPHLTSRVFTNLWSSARVW